MKTKSPWLGYLTIVWLCGSAIACGGENGSHAAIEDGLYRIDWSWVEQGCNIEPAMFVSSLVTEPLEAQDRDHFRIVSGVRLFSEIDWEPDVHKVPRTSADAASWGSWVTLVDGCDVNLQAEFDTVSFSGEGFSFEATATRELSAESVSLECEQAADEQYGQLPCNDVFVITFSPIDRPDDDIKRDRISGWDS